MAMRRELTYILYGLAAVSMLVFQFAPGQPISGEVKVFRNGQIVEEPVINEHMAAWGVQETPWTYTSTWAEEQPNAKELHWTGPLSLLVLVSALAGIATLRLPRRLWRLLPVALVLVLAFATTMAQNGENDEAFDRCHEARDTQYPSNNGGGCHGGTNLAAVFLASAAIFAAVGGATVWQATGSSASSPLPNIED